MSDLIYYLEKIDRYVEQYCNTSNNRVSILAEGISREEIDRLIFDQVQFYTKRNPKSNLNNISFNPCEDFYQLHQWHNGAESYSQITEFSDSIEYISFLNEEIYWYDLKSTLNINESGVNCSLFLDEGGGSCLTSNKKLHQESKIFFDWESDSCCSLTEFIKGYAEVLDITLNLLFEKGNFDGDYKDRLESWENIVITLNENQETNWAFKWLSITGFLNAALNVEGYDSKLWYSL